MDGSYIKSLFNQIQGIVNVKIIKSRITGMSERYGFIEFKSHEIADKVLKEYNGKLIPGTRR